ncbi:MAG: hypothetical protein CMO44_19330 [Verrucomicrobiales bacterium]|nr:hypothetical protein [Verrucomicrobiales bacterium]|tara:strand:+ start:5614 stop:5862 length:249 start_codon:yes stop_codon:yes gene_type:complete
MSGMPIAHKELLICDGLTKIYGPLMDLDDLASTLRLKKATLYQRIYLDKLSIPRIKNGKKYLFQTKDVADFLLENCGNNSSH